MSYGQSISLEDANRTEYKYIQSATKAGWVYTRHANYLEDVRSHWDLMFSRSSDKQAITVDVKSQKKKYRGGPPLLDYLLVEWKNVSGNNGWLLGEANKIGFEYNSYFYTFDRKELMNFAFLNTDFNKIVSRPFDAINCIYTRENRKDQITLLSLSDLLNSLYYDYWIISE